MLHSSKVAVAHPAAAAAKLHAHFHHNCGGQVRNDHDTSHQTWHHKSAQTRRLASFGSVPTKSFLTAKASKTADALNKKLAPA